MKTYVSPQEQKRDSNVSRMTTRVDKSVHDVVARAAKIGGLSISKYMEQAILKQALADIYFEDIALLRNEQVYKIYDFEQGRGFQPDFLLFCKQKEGEELTFQVFIEPKGGHLISHDKWKEDFLKELEGEKRIIKINTDRYRITGVPFYNNKIENDVQGIS